MKTPAVPSAVPKAMKRLAQSTRGVGRAAARKLRGRQPKTGSDVPVAREGAKLLAEAGAQEGDSETSPDVLLDVPMLKVDKIALDVDALRARVSLRAELAELVKIEVGADVDIARVSLTIEGVEAQALLKARLERVYQIFSRALETIDQHPEVLTSVLKPVGEAAMGALENVERAAGSEAVTRVESPAAPPASVDDQGTSGE